MKAQFERIRKALASLLAAAILAGLLPAAALAAEPVSFADVEGHWAAEAITDVVSEGLFTGIDADTFAPDNGMTRSMFVTVLYRLAQKLNAQSAPAASVSFTDVAADAWYADSVAWAVSNGITTGYSDQQFGPDDLVTREQMCVFMVRFLNFMGYDLSDYAPGAAFADDASISDWARESVYLAKAIGLIEGVGGNTFAPKDSATRASVAVIGARLMDKADQLATGSGTSTPVPPVEPTPEPSPEPTDKPSGGGGGGNGGGSGSSGSSGGSDVTPTVALTGVYVLRDTVSATNENMTGKKVYSGDRLHASVTPSNAIYAVRWLVGGVEKSRTTVYEVDPMDAGKTIQVEATGFSGYSGTVTSPATGAVQARVDIDAADPDQSPVVVESGATYLDENKQPIVVSSDAQLSLQVDVTDESAPDTEAAAIKTQIESTLTAALGEGESIDPPTVVAVDVNLVMTESDGTETTVHPVGQTTVTLSAEALGVQLREGETLSLYTFAASHTNQKGTVEQVDGEVVTIDGVEYVRFVLNGLSRIYIGNVPPLTVTFDTDGGSAVPAQKVKLGGFAKNVEPPVKSGWVFAGWDHDLTTENIIKDITVKAIWVQGELAGNEQLTGTWSTGAKPEVIAEPTVADGTVTIYVDTETTYPVDLSYTLQVAAPEGAVKAAVASTAEAAASSTQYTDVSASLPSITAQVSDANGRALTSSQNLYIKWVDANGEVLELQSARLVVRTEGEVPGNYDTQTRVETLSVNRGLGTVEYYLTGGTQGDTALPDYVGAVNGYLNHSWSSASHTSEYYLTTYGNFYDSFPGSPDYITCKNYTGIKLVVTPFQNQSFATTPTATATLYDGEGSQSYPVSVVLEGGNAVLTCAMPTQDDVSLNISMELNGVAQSFSIHLNHSSGRTYSNYQTEVWSEALAALQGNEYDSITYTGAADAVVDAPLSIPLNKSLYISNASLVVKSTLTLNADNSDSANLSVSGGKITVADGGVLTTNSQSGNQTSYTYAYARGAQGITVESGGRVSVPSVGHLQLNGGDGGLTLDQGGSIDTTGRLMVTSGNGETGSVFAGTVTINTPSSDWNRDSTLEINDGLTLTATAQVTVAADAVFDVYGGLIMKEGAQLTTSGDTMLSGRSELWGDIAVNGGQLSLYNTGYSVYHYGAMTVVSGVQVDAGGTVLVNEGTITGGGTLYTGELEDLSDYDNGIEYVETGLSWSDRTPDNYDRYQFVRDPAEMVEAIYFMGQLLNQNGGTCTLSTQ